MEKKPCGGAPYSNKDTNRSRSKSRRSRRRQQNRHFENNPVDNNYHNGQSTSSDANNTTTGTIPTDIPGYFFDSEKNRYFKISNDYTPKKSVDKNNSASSSIKSVDKILKKNVPCSSMPHYFRSRELSNVFNAGILKRKDLEHWAQQVVERKSFVLTGVHPFEGCISRLALSSNGSKMATVLKLLGPDCDAINIFSVNHDKEDFICQKIVATIVASEVTHIEWNSNKNMDNYILLSLLGSENSKGSGLVCKLNESSAQSCDLESYVSYPLPHGTAWSCSWCTNPLYSHLIGIAGTKQAVLVDFDKRTSFCRISSPSDVFCVEFCHRSPVVYLGCRNGDIMCVDMRMKSRNQNKPFNNIKSSSSKTWIKMMQDENYFMASTIDGMIKMWDVRLSRPVKEYHGNVNETKLIPFVMDSSQSVIASAGQDGKTRIWSIDSCDLLKSIPNIGSNDTGNEDTGSADLVVAIPPVCLGEQWGNRAGMMGFGLGVYDRLNIYY